MSVIEREVQRDIWRDIDEVTPLWMWGIEPTAQDGFAAFATAWDAVIIEAASKLYATD